MQNNQFFKLLGQFQKRGYEETTNLNEQDMKITMHKILNQCQNETNNCFENLQQADEIIKEVWHNTNKKPNGQANIAQFIETFGQAKRLLVSHVSRLENELENQKDQENKKKLQQDLVAYSNDLKTVNVLFGLQPHQESKLVVQSRTTINNSKRRSQLPDTSILFSMTSTKNQTSQSLTLVFFINLLLFFFELVIIFHKDHFLNILVYFAIFAIYFLGYFTKIYIRFTLVFILISCGFDVAWLVVQAKHFWNLYEETQHSTLNNFFYCMICVLVAVLIFGKFFQFLLLLKYSKNSSKARKIVTLKCFQFEMSVKIHDPITNLIRGTP